MTTVYATAVDPHPWGESRRWNAWIEFWIADEMVASSALGDFAVTEGRVTEDITRSICRDVDLTLYFPLTPRYSNIAVYSISAGTGPFTVGSSEVGGTDVLGGGDSVTVQTPASAADTRRNPLVPVNIGDLLDPHSASILHIYAGWTGEEVRLGIFDIASVPVKIGPGAATLTLSGLSFERRIDKGGFWKVENATDGQSVTSAAAYLVNQVISDVLVRPETSAATTAAISWKPGDNRLQAIVKLLESAGMIGYFDRDNVFRIERGPSLDDLSNQTDWTWEIIDGQNGVIATLHSASRTFSDEESYNGVVIEGTNHETGATPVVYVLWNDNPASPLYFDPNNPTVSAGGPRPKHITSDLVTTEADAAAMALAELAKVLTIADAIDAEVPANANIQMGQYARFTSDDLGVDGIYRIVRVAHDLTGGPAQLTLQRFSVV